MFLCLNALSGIGGVRTYEFLRFPQSIFIGVLMPCRALEAFGLTVEYGEGKFAVETVLMPCRALEAFGPAVRPTSPPAVRPSLNALSGIGGVRTKAEAKTDGDGGEIGLNALSGIGGVRTYKAVAYEAKDVRLRLNALSGIGGVRTIGISAVPSPAIIAS